MSRKHAWGFKPEPGEFPQGATHCDGPNCCVSRSTQKPGSGIEVAREENDPQGTHRWFCSVECQSQRGP